MKLSRRQLRKMILEALSDKSQRYREPIPGNVASVRLPPPPADQSVGYDIPPGYYHDLLQMYMRSGNFDDAEKLKAKMIRLGIDPIRGA